MSSNFDMSALLGAFGILPPMGATGDGSGGASGNSGAEGASGQSVAAPVQPPGTVDADFALRELAEIYKMLMQQAARITKLYGSNVPCTMQAAHNEAVGAYVAASRQTFNQILAQNPKANIIQKVYDQTGKLLGTTTSATPIMPTTLRTGNCPNTVPVLSGPVVVGLRGAVGAGGLGVPALLGWGITIIVALFTGGAAVLAMHIYVNRAVRPLEAIEARKVWVEIKLDCVERKIAQLRQLGKTIDMEAINQECGVLAGAAPPDARDPQTANEIFWFKVIAVAGATLVGGIILYQWLSPNARMQRTLMNADLGSSVGGSVKALPACRPRRLRRKRAKA